MRSSIRSIGVLCFGVLGFGVNLVFDGLQLFAHYEIEVEFAFHLFLVWKLGEEKV